MSSAPRALACWSRSVIAESGAQAAETFVHCPKDETIIEVDDCAACAYRVASTVEDGKAKVLCAHQRAEPVSDTQHLDRGARPTTADRTPVSALMSTDVLCVTVDLPLAELRTLLLERRFGGVPVLDHLGEAIGVVSRGDLLRARSGARTAGDAMTAPVFTVMHNAPISQAAALMAYARVHRLPVVADDGRVVGIVSTLDVVRWLADHDGYTVDRAIYR